MRDWSLTAGDPLYLTLAADARLCASDYLNDHIWELELGGGDPPALALRTTYGLRARSMRIFLRFSEGKAAVTDPAKFVSPPRLRRFYPNFLHLDLVPLENLSVAAEYWIPESHIAATRLTLVNHAPTPRRLALEVCATLAPLDGQSLASTQLQLVHVLAGQTGGLVPVVFITGGPQHGPGPHPSLLLNVELAPHSSRQFTMAQAATDTLATSFELARRTAARPWDAERARIELHNAAETIEIETGDPNWDAALAFSQSAAFGLAFPAGAHLPHASFVSARQPDQGFSRKGDGSDYPPSWNGLSALEAYYLSLVISGAPGSLRGSIPNFISAQLANGEIDHKPGITGQRSRLLATPLLASLAWRYFAATSDLSFLQESYPALTRFFWSWFSAEHDRDRDGLPEWDHPMQTGFEDNPAFDVWHPWSQGLSISLVKSPALLAMLYAEAQSLIKIAARLGLPAEPTASIRLSALALKSAVESSWNPRTSLYAYRDRETGLSQSGKPVAKRRGPGPMKAKAEFDQPTRLLIEVQTKNPAATRPQVEITDGTAEPESVDGHQFQWRTGGLVATSLKVYRRVDEITVRGLDAGDRIVVRTVDTSAEDLTLTLPLWAGIPGKKQAQAMVEHAIKNSERFDGTCGLPALPLRHERAGAIEAGESTTVPGQPITSVLSESFSRTPLRLASAKRSAEVREADTVAKSVHLPWNALIGLGLLQYGFRPEAVRLIAHLMNAVILNLKQNHTFYQRYHADRGAGIGERNSLHGLAPVGLFLEALGVTVYSATRVRLEGKNIFPWPVTVKYCGLTVVRGLDRTVVTFPNGQSTTVRDKAPCVVSM
jgi:hypothetical protein